MIKLNVVDLDDTLLPYDSLNEYIGCFIRKPKQFVPLIFILAMRKLRLINKSSFLRLIMGVCRKAADYNTIMKSLAKNCCANLDQDVLTLVHKWTDNSTILVLCTASPSDYTKYIADYLGWKLLASDLNDRGFVHMSASNKIKHVNDQYPPGLYDYNFAISDSICDNDLLLRFNNYVLKTINFHGIIVNNEISS